MESPEGMKGTSGGKEASTRKGREKQRRASLNPTDYISVRYILG